MTDAKQKVLDWVRSKNPFTMELKKGCKIRCQYGLKTTVEDFDDFIWVQGGKLFVPSPKGRVRMDRVNEYEILGSDMGLDCFARAFKEHFPDARIEWDKEHPHYMYFFSGRDSAEFVAYDLRKDNLHDQDDKFFVQLNPFLK